MQINQKHFEKVEIMTAEAMKEPKPGDVFHEMFSYWVFVLYVDDSQVIFMDGNGHPSRFPEAGRQKSMSREGFYSHFAYGTIPGFWVMLSDREYTKCLDWLDQSKVKKEVVFCPHCKEVL